MINLVLFGPPGAGKGTQSEKLIERFKLVHLSTGNLLRAEITEGTPLGLKAKSLMDAGLLVPDEVVIGMIDNKLRENPDAPGFIFDGFPRTVPQAQALDNLMETNGLAISGMVALEVSDEELVHRLLERGKTSGRPDDQNQALIRQRVEEYNAKTLPVADFYRNQNKFTSINGTGSINEIFTALCSAIGQ